MIYIERTADKSNIAAEEAKKFSKKSKSSSWFSAAVDVGCDNSESIAGYPMEVSKTGDNFYLHQKEVVTLEIMEFEDIRFFAQSWPSCAFALRGFILKSYLQSLTGRTGWKKWILKPQVSEAHCLTFQRVS